MAGVGATAETGSGKRKVVVHGVGEEEVRVAAHTRIYCE